MQKTSFKTRLLALLTAVFMVIMCVPFAAFADGSVKDIWVAYIDEETARQLASRRRSLSLLTLTTSRLLC